MAVAVSAFPPTREFQDYLLNYFIDNYDGPSEVKVLAPYCYYRLEKTIAHGPESTPLAVQQIEEYIKKGGPPCYSALFGGTIEYIISLQRGEGLDLDVPELLPLLTNTIKKHGGFSCKGIFRVAADTVQVKALVAQLASGDYDIKSGTDPNIVADVLKIWLRDLSEPIIPAHLYENCLRASESQDRSVKLIEELPAPQFATLDFLFSFLAELLQHQSVTAMGPENLAIVFSPNLLRSEEKDPTTLLRNSTKVNNFVRHCVLHWAAKAKK